jgi:hypothetical protein
MAKTRLLPLKAGLQIEPNTLRKRYQIVTKICLFRLAPVYTGVKIWVLENERVSKNGVQNVKLPNLRRTS